MKKDKIDQLREDCTNHVDHDMGYAEWFDYCDRKAKEGVEQIECPNCGLWIWPDHWRGKARVDRERK